MAIERVEWQCPQCGRRYAIPASLPRPSLCPKCSVAEEETPAPPTVPAALSPRPEVAGQPQSQQPAFEPPPAEQTFAASRYRRKYPALRVIALIYRCLAVVILIGTVIVFAMGVVSMLQVEDQELRWALVTSRLTSFVVGLFWSVTALAFAELIQVALDIEQNTRR